MELITVYLLVLGAVVFVMAAYLLAHDPSVAAVLVLGNFVLESATRNNFGAGAGALTLYAADAVFLLLLMAVVIRLFTGRFGFTRTRVYLAILAALFAFSIVRGFGTNGLQTAGVEARPIFYFLAGVIYFGTFDLSRQTFDRFMHLIVGAAILLCAIAAWRVATTGLGSSTGVYVDGVYVDGRPLSASAALLISQALVMVLFFPKMVPFFGRWPLLSAVLLFAVVILQHRTVWAALLATLMMGMLSRTDGRRRLGVLLLGFVFVVPITAVFLFGGNLTPVRQNLGTSALSAFQEEGTFNWRLEGWASLLSDPANSSPASLAVGRSFGSGFDRRVNGVLVTYSPHNFYVNTLLRLGIPGLVLILLLYLEVFSTKGNDALKDHEPLGLIRLLSLAQLVYFVSYAPSSDQGLVLGSIIGLLATVSLAHGDSTERMAGYVSGPATKTTSLR